MQKIAHVNFAKGFRGGERQTLLLIETLSKLGFTQQLFTRKHSKLAQKAKNIKNLKIIQIKKPYIFSLSKIKNIDILHAHEAKAAQFSYFVHLRYKIPYIITRRVDIPIRDNFLNKKIYQNAKYCIALSSAIEKRILMITNKSQIQIIPDAFFSFQIDKNNTKTLASKYKNKFVVGHIGELDNQTKGQSYIIKAAKKIEKEFPNILFVFLGKGKDEVLFKEETKDMNNINFEGFIDNVGDYISIFDLFIFPSLHEGFGSTLLDVMHLDVPIIASNVGGIPDIVKHEQNGLLINPKDSDALHQNIIKLYQDKLLAKTLSKHAKTDVLLFTPNIIAQKYINVYRKT